MVDILSILLLLLPFVASQAQPPNDPLYWALSVEQRAGELGFGYEEHQVTTEDGYIITLMRIPYGPENQFEQNKEPIFMLHPVFDSAEAWTRTREFSPAFRFADANYDVWLYNVRGNVFSREHVTLDPTLDREYWAFTMAELRFDHVASIRYIIETTAMSQVKIFALSYGGATLAMTLAQEPDFIRENVAIAALAAAPVSMANTDSVMFSMLGNYPFILDSIRAHGYDLVLDQNPVINIITYQF